MPDESGLRLMEQWIAGMNGGGSEKTDNGGNGWEETALSNPRSALSLARKLGRGELPPDKRSELLTAAAKLPVGPTRDLFEGYQPVDETNRKLGSSPRPRSILSLAGDAGRGEAIFWSQAVNCGSCHKIGDRGNSVGPDLSTIGKQRTRNDLLENILEPSRRIEPQYAAYIAKTHDGALFTGLVIKRDDSGVVLRDAQNKEIALATAEIEQLQPSRTSLMPQSQIAGLTAQEAADLIEYLATRR
jgi:putative heme-binding domain-containing protein